MKQREIVLLPYPFSDLSANKVRPALIVSNNQLNHKSSDCVMVPLTTILKKEPYSIDISQKDMQEGNLIKPSRIRTDKVFAASKSLIIKHVGTINEAKCNEVINEIKTMF